MSLKSFILFFGFIFFSSFLKCQDFIKDTFDPSANDGAQSYGSSFIDFDNDGDLDLYVTNYSQQNNLLYQNNGSGSFVEINNYLTNFSGSSLGQSWIDVDSDCDLDLFVSNGGEFSSEKNKLFINSSGTYTLDVTSPIYLNFGSSQSSNWGDYDNDGDLDLFVANLSGENNFFYINNGNLNFTLSPPILLNTDGHNSNDANWVDYDGDGDLDLFVANQSNERNLLYENINGVFSEITNGPIVNNFNSSYGSCWGDYDNDGDLDLYVCNSSNQKNSLYSNEGNSNFKKVITGQIVTDNGNSYGSSWIDYDNDGFLDLFVTNSAQKNCLYKNNGNSTFSKINTGSIVNDVGASRSSNWADIDNDGDLDCYVTNRSYSNNYLYRNNVGSKNNWLNIKLNSTASNNDCIGAVVRVKALINGDNVWQMRVVSSKSGYCAQESPNLEFGFGSTTQIDSIVVEWPTSKTKCYYTNVQSNQFLNYYENCTPLGDVSVMDSVCYASQAFLKTNTVYNWYSDSSLNTYLSTDSFIDLGILYNDSTVYFIDQNQSCNLSVNEYTVILSNELNTNLPNDSILCKGDSLLLNIGINNASFKWDNNSFAADRLLLKDGLYWVDVTSNNCQIRDSIHVLFDDPPKILLGNDTSICNNTWITIKPKTVVGSSQYLWNDNSMDENIIVGEGTYWVSNQNKCGYSSDSIIVSYEDCISKFSLPSIFTPNLDNINDHFVPLENENLKSIEITIYNRWGLIQYESKGPTFKWDGYNEKREIVSAGTYYYVIEYINLLDERYNLNGFVTILR